VGNPRSRPIKNMTGLRAVERPSQWPAGETRLQLKEHRGARHLRAVFPLRRTRSEVSSTCILMPTTIELFGFFRSPAVGFSDISMTSEPRRSERVS